MMTLNMRRALLAGTAIVAVGAFTATTASAAEVTTAGGTDWGAVAVDSAGSDADSVTFGGADVVTVDDAEDIGTTTTNSLSMSVDTRTSTGEVIFDGGALAPATGSIVYGAVGDSSDFTVTGNAATLTLGDGASNEGANVSLFGNVAAGTIINVDSGVGTTTTLTLGNGTTATTVGANIDLDEGTAGDSDTILNLNGTTVTGTITNTDTDNTTPFAINVDANSSLDGNVDLTTVAGNVLVDDGVTLSVGAATFDVLAAGTVVLGDGATDGATLVFDGTTAQAVTGVIDGDADFLSTVSITNTTDVVTFNQAIGATNDLGNFTLAADSSVNTAGDLNSQTITIGSGATLNADEDVTGNVVNSGTFNIGTGGGDVVTGNVTGTGTLETDGSASIIGNVSQGAVTVGTAHVLTIDAGAENAGTVSLGTATLDNGASRLLFISNAGGTQTISGSIAGDDNDGIVSFGDDTDEVQNYVVNATIGTDAADIEDLTVGGNTNDDIITATLNANAYADDVDIGNGDVLNLHGTTYEFDTVDSSAAAAGTLNVGSGTSATTLTANGAIGGGNALTALNVRDGATLVANNNITATAFDIEGNVTVQGGAGSTWTGTTTVGDEAVITANGAITLAGGGMTFGDAANDTVSFNVGSNADIDPTAVAGIAAGNQTLTFTVGSVTTMGLSSSQSDQVQSGDTILFVTGAANADFDTEVSDGRIVFNNGLLTFDYNETVANTISADVAYANAANVFAAGSTGAGAANAIVNLTPAETTASTELAAIRSSLLGAGSVAAQQAIAESLAPTVDGAFVAAGVQASDLTFNVVNDRLEIARAGGSDTGMVAGEMGEGLTVWAKGFGQLANQDRRDGVAGYDADTYGAAIGIDSENLIDNGLVGMSFSYANTDIESENVNSTDTDVDSYQVSLYGSKGLNDGMYVSGMVGYTMGNIDQTRYNVAGVAGNNAKSDFDSDQYSAYAEFGRNFNVNSMTVTPKVLANYAHMEFDGYTETGSTANQVVATDDVDVLELGVGVNAAWNFDDNMGNTITPSLSAEYRYDVIGDEVQTTSNFTGGGAAFQTQGFDPAQSSFAVGAGVAYDMDNVTVSADYGYQFKEDYDAHNVSVRAGVNF